MKEMVKKKGEAARDTPDDSSFLMLRCVARFFHMLSVDAADWHYLKKNTTLAFLAFNHPCNQLVNQKS